MTNLISLALLLTLVGCGQAPLPSSRPVVRTPPEAHMAPPRATDHIATMVVSRGYGPPGEDRHLVMRAGGWIREERTSQGRTVFVHSDLGSGVSINYARDSAGRIFYLQADRHPASDRYHVMRRVPTGRRGRALGERCEVWSTTRVGERPGEGVNWLSCETRDGVQLWTRAESLRSGSVLGSARATSVERRPLRREEVRPPAALLDLASWREGSVFPAAATPRYDVRFEAAGGGGVRILRRQGEWTYSERPGLDGGRRLDIRNDVAFFGYEEEVGGRPVRLNLQRRRDDQPVDEERWNLIDHRAPETMLGETCRWMVPANLPTDTTHNECRTADGVPLALEEGSWGTSTRYVAVSATRAPLTATAFAPPPRSSDWAAWGILDR